MNKIVVKGSTLGDSLVGGDQYSFNIHIPPADPTVIIRGLENFQKLTQDDEDFQDFLDRLNFYVNQKNNIPVIGLEKKLVNGGRADLVTDAVERKDAFAKRLLKSQLNTRRQWIYLYVLQKISSAFEGLVRPLIKKGATGDAIDATIYYGIVSNIYNEVVGIDSTIDQYTISGMIYFLTGKCHLIWEP